MNQEELDNYMGKRLEPQLDWYNNKASQNKLVYHCLQWTAIAISPVVPAMIAWAPDNLKLLTISLSIALAIVTSSLKTFRFQEHWINYRTIAGLLEREKHLYTAKASEYELAESTNRLLVERTEEILSRENMTWLQTQVRKEEDKEEN